MVTKANKTAKTAKTGARRKRPSQASSDELSETVKGAVREVAGAMKTAAQTSLGAALEASAKMAAALPPKRSVMSAVGRALVSGGRALIDPRVAVGELAVRLGEGLLEDADQLRWFIVRLDDAGHATTFGFVKRADAQAFFDTTLQAFPRQYLCETVAGPGR